MQEEIERNVSCIRDVLSYNRIDIRDIQVVEGPVLSLYKIYVVPGVKIPKVKELADDFAMAIGVTSVRTVTLRDSIGVEVPNRERKYMPLEEMLESSAFLDSYDDELPVVIGHTIDGKVRVIDLVDAPHILVSGATKQGKTMCLKALRASLEARKNASELKIYWLDPRAMDASIIMIGETLEQLCLEMDNRFCILSDNLVNNIKKYNKRSEKHMPYIVVFIDEYADLSVNRSIKNSIIRMAQKGRAVGIHLILATQRPTVDVISGLIKANFPTRIAFRVASRIDSTTILDQPGAEKLIGNGDMLFSSGVEMERLQCGMVDQS